MTKRKNNTAKLPEKAKRTQIVYSDGEIIYTGPERIGNTFAPFSETARQTILTETGAGGLRLYPKRHEQWWTTTSRQCCEFVSSSNLEELPYPTRKELDDFLKSARDFMKHLKPLLDVDGAFDTGADCAFLYAYHIIKRVEHGGFRRPVSKKTSGLRLVSALGRLYEEGFGRPPGSGPTGPFVRFVQACVKATDWHGAPPSGAIIQSHVRAIFKDGGFHSPPGRMTPHGGNGGT